MRTRSILVLSLISLIALMVVAACDSSALTGSTTTVAPTAAPAAQNVPGANATPSGPGGQQPGGQFTPGAGGPGGGQRPPNFTPGAGGPGGGQRPPNFTPGAGGPGGGQRPPNFTPGAGAPGGQRPGAQATPANSTTGAQPAPTQIIVSAVTLPASSSGGRATAVPIPTIVIPTIVPVSAAKPTVDANTDTTSAPLPIPAVVRRTPTPTPNLADLRGQIIFFSDRTNGTPQLHVMNSDGSSVRLCNCSELWEGLFAQENYAPDKQKYLYVRAVGPRNSDAQIWIHNDATNSDSVLTGNAPNWPNADYDAVWSPDGRYVAWVSAADGNDEIYTLDLQLLESKRLTFNTYEWDKRPSFSPDSTKLAFWSNRETAYKQIWVMDRNGSNVHNISNNQFNDWDPLWVK